MLVIISDLHLTDGTSGETIINENHGASAKPIKSVSDGAFRLFKNRVSDMAYDASWRCDDKDNEFYEPIKEINILLLGDILDMIRTEKWNKDEESIMPWTPQQDEKFYENIRDIADGILKNNEFAFRILKGISDGDVKIPTSMRPATEQEKQDKKIQYVASGELQSLKVNIFYMIGNHDWFFYIRDERMNPIRNSVIDALGLCNKKDCPFPYYPEEFAELQQVQKAHRVYALHGDMFDESNYQSPDRNKSSIGDVIVIKLLNAIPSKVEEYINEYPAGAVGTAAEIKAFIGQLREIDNLRPYSLAPAWITQALADSHLDKKMVNESIKKALHDLIDNFIKNDIVSHHMKLEIGMKIAGFLFGFHFTIEDLSSIISHFSFSKDQVESYKQYASKMVEMKEGTSKDFFVMGHTHYPEIVPLSTYRDGDTNEKRNRIYFNSGTWRTLHKTGSDDGSFISYKTMTIIGLYEPEERKGRAFEFWTASLAL